MIYLFSEPGLKFLESVFFADTLYAFDFDGTLAPIVREPGLAKMRRQTSRLIEEINDLNSIAIISGRSLADLKDRLGFKPGFLVGNHGLEGIHSGTKKLEAFSEICESWQKLLRAYLEEIDGVEIEDKKFSMALHYRKSRTKKHVKSKLLQAVLELKPSARIVLGKCVINIIPPGAPHKGIALLELLIKSEKKSAFYIGDDDTDEDVFALADPRIFSVRVGRRMDSAAKFYIQSQNEIDRLLELIFKFFRRSSRAKADR